MSIVKGLKNIETLLEKPKYDENAPMAGEPVFASIATFL